MADPWKERVLEAFAASAGSYDASAQLQGAVAWRLAHRCQRQQMSPGLWVDLGSGTGRLADALEQLHPQQAVLRVDGSAAMLSRHRDGADTLLHDLNADLPNWPTAPVLMGSSFVLHWLDDPPSRLRHWFDQLATGGWLVVAVPVQGCFQQWQEAATRAGAPCTALPFPSMDDLLEAVPAEAVRWRQLHRFTRRGRHPLELLRPMIRTGANITPADSLGPAAWRRLFRSWPDPDRPSLSWTILTLMLQR